MKVTNYKIHLKVSLYITRIQNTQQHRTQHTENPLVAKAKNPLRHGRIVDQKSKHTYFFLLSTCFIVGIIVGKPSCLPT